MATDQRLTIPELRGSIERQYGKQVPDWKLRRVVDSFNDLHVYRAGNYRLISAGDVGVIADELRRQGWLPQRQQAGETPRG